MLCIKRNEITKQLKKLLFVYLNKKCYQYSKQNKLNKKNVLTTHYDSIILHTADCLDLINKTNSNYVMWVDKIRKKSIDFIPHEATYRINTFDLH